MSKIIDPDTIENPDVNFDSKSILINKRQAIIRARETPTGIKIKQRNEDGSIEFVELPFPNYFYMNAKDYEDASFLIGDDIKYFSSIEEDERGIKLIMVNNFDRYKIKSKLEFKGITLYEADIQTHKRWLIDHHPELNTKGLKWLMYDIETKDDTPIEQDMRGTIIAREPVLSVAYKDDVGNEHFIKNMNKNSPVQGEIEILRFHEKIIQKYDIIMGWNSYRFDDSYMKQRAEFHNISNYHWDFINQVDYMETVKKNLYPPIDRYNLDFVSRTILGEQKLEGFKAGGGNVLKAWKDSFDGDDTLERYNRQDVQLMWNMEKKLNFMPLQMNQADIAGCFIQETLHNSEAWDMILLTKYKERNLLAPTKPSKEQIEKRKKDEYVAGAYTFCLSPGFHKDVEVFDFKSFYPTTITACNICPTTLISDNYGGIEFDNCVEIPQDIHTVSLSGTKNPFLIDLKKNEKSNSENIEAVQLEKSEVKFKFKKKFFSLKERGIVSNTMDMYIAERDKTKYLSKIEKDPIKKTELRSIEWSYKTLANSGYGVLGQPAFRFFNADIANAITQFCRHLIKECVLIAEQFGFKVVQGDTDSIMFKNITNVHTKEDLEYEFYKAFDKFAAKQNIKSKKFTLTNPKTKEKEEKDHYIVFEHEKTFSRMISVKKKNYADLKYDIDKEGKPIGEPKVSITGLECKKKDTNPLAKIMQKDLIEDVLFEKFKEDYWLDKVQNVKNDLLNNDMDTEYLIMRKTLNKPIEDYGKAMIDGTTGLPKLKADGTPRFASIPAHVKLAKQLIAKGYTIFPGDSISYIVKSSGPIVPISEDEYKDGEEFDREYYWERIMNPVMKILFVTHPHLIMDNAKLWSIKNLDEKKLTNYIVKLQKNCLKEEE